MKRIQTIAVVLTLSASALAVDVKSVWIGIGIGLGMTAYSGTRNHVILPAAHAIQRSIRPVPQDRIDKANRKAAKATRKAAKHNITQPPPVCDGSNGMPLNLGLRCSDKPKPLSTPIPPAYEIPQCPINDPIDGQFCSVMGTEVYVYAHGQYYPAEILKGDTIEKH